MGWKLGASVAVLAALGVSGTATAGQKCARPTEVTAIQVAAIQQELMVAALTCHDVTNFNAFQTGYAKELRRSDRRLRHMFHRLFGSRGDSQYHAFKTRLANNSSIRSIHDNAAYCKEAQLVFAAALTPQKPTLADFVSGVAVHDDSPVDQLRYPRGHRFCRCPGGAQYRSQAQSAARGGTDAGRARGRHPGRQRASGGGRSAGPRSACCCPVADRMLRPAPVPAEAAAD